MKIVLINTPYLHVYGKVNTGHNCSFPLGLGYIASYVRSFGHEVKLYDPEAQGMSLEDMWPKIEAFSPDIIGVTAVTSNFMLSKKIASTAKEKIGCYVIMGGPHVNALSESSLKGIPSLDAVIMGEGEIPMLEIAKHFDKNKSIDFSQISGAVYFKNGLLQRNSRPPLISDLDALPYPARDLVDIYAYKIHAHFQRGKRSATILSSRGCPSRCTFCGNHVMKRLFRPRSAGNFVDELEYLVEEYNIRHFHIVDDCFTYDSQRVVDICDIIIERNLDISWFIFGRVDTLLDLNVIKKMKKAGLVYVLLGIESGNQEICNIMRKGTTIEMAERCCLLLKKTGVNYFNSFIIANEGDTRKTVLETIDLSIKLRSVMAGFNVMIPFPGTAIFKKFFKDYDSPNTDWNNWCSVGDDIPYKTRQTTLSKKEILELTSLANKKFYLRVSQLIKILMFANNFKAIVSFLKGGFGLLRYTLSMKKLTIVKEEAKN